MRRDDGHLAQLGGLHLSLVPRYLAGFHCDQATAGAPQCPRSPSADLPRSQTPVVSCVLALAPPGRLPSRACPPSASPDETHFGAPSRGLPARDPRLRTLSGVGV